MKKIVTLRQALSDKQYFGGQLDSASWAAWRVLLWQSWAKPLTDAELSVFTMLTRCPAAFIATSKVENSLQEFGSKYTFAPASLTPQG